MIAQEQQLEFDFDASEGVEAVLREFFGDEPVGSATTKAIESGRCRLLDSGDSGTVKPGSSAATSPL